MYVTLHKTASPKWQDAFSERSIRVPKNNSFSESFSYPTCRLRRHAFIRVLSSQFDHRLRQIFQNNLPTMEEENVSRRSSERSSSEATLLGKEKHDDETSDTSKTSSRKSFLRRIILPLTIHFTIFLVYSTLVLFALSPRSRDPHKARNLLYCTSID